LNAETFNRWQKQLLKIIFFYLYRDPKNVTCESKPSSSGGNLLSNDLLGLSVSSGNTTATNSKPSEIGILKSPQIVVSSQPAKPNNYSSDLLGLGAGQSSDFDFLGMGSTTDAATGASPNNLFNNNAPHTR
jgi:hypothetical protein